MTTISIPARIYDELIAHFSSSDVEEVAFLFTEPPAAHAPLRVREIYRVPPDGFDFQSNYHVALTDETRAHVIKRAHDLTACLVEAHSHGEAPIACFSASDLDGFRDWVPHVRWRLRRRPYVALVFAGEQFDALLWNDDAEGPQPVTALQIDGRPPRRPSGLTHQHLSDHSL
jgi:hypothetical protein